MHLIARDKIPRFVTNARQATPPFCSGSPPFLTPAAAKNPALEGTESAVESRFSGPPESALGDLEKG